jgi:lysozyme
VDEWPIHRDGVELIKACEGFRSRAYICPAGVWTIGWGATRDLAGNRVTKETPDIDEEEAEQILARDLVKFAGAVDRLVTVSIGQRQRAALASFAFNLGAGQLKCSTLLRKINGDEWQDVPKEFMKWVYGGGRILPGLQRRRRMEVELWLEEA